MGYGLWFAAWVGCAGSAPEVPAVVNPPDSDVAEDSAPAAPVAWRSALYPADWAPGFAVGDASLPDFSYAGWHNGEGAPPSPPVDRVVEGGDPTGLADSTAAIQAALDLGGVVRLPAGTWRVDGLLTVATSGTVLRGDGPDATFVHFTAATGMEGVANLTFAGASRQGTDRPLAVDGAAGSREVTLTDPAGLAVGDDVLVGWTITPAFIEAHGMTGVWAVSADRWRPFFRRTVVAIDGDRVTLDVPLRYPALLRDGASPRVETGALRDVGLEGLAVSSAVDPTAAWTADRSHAVALVGVTDGFVRDVVSWSPPGADDGDHLQSGGLLVQQSKRVTVSDVHLAEAQNRGEGGNGYLFEVMQSAEVLIADCTARAGRHNFIQNWDFGTSGVVFLRTVSTEGQALTSRTGSIRTVGASEFHHSLAMANLIDHSVTDDAWKAANRGSYSSGAGHSATQTVFWNTAGAGALSSYQFGLGYVIGTTGLTVNTAITVWPETSGSEPEDWAEGVDAGGTLEPASLYEDQLARRLARGEVRWP